MCMSSEKNSVINFPNSSTAVYGTIGEILNYQNSAPGYTNYALCDSKFSSVITLTEFSLDNKMVAECGYDPRTSGFCLDNKTHHTSC